MNEKLKMIEIISRYNKKKIVTDINNHTLSDTETILSKVFVSEWTMKKYTLNEVVSYDGKLYRCCQAHDATGNPAWIPTDAQSLWAILHGATPETAQDWVQPSGAHDMYITGEYCIYNAVLYKCVNNTSYAPGIYGWELVE